jgi:outer membrane biosynthesis protein TonB
MRIGEKRRDRMTDAQRVTVSAASAALLLLIIGRAVPPPLVPAIQPPPTPKVRLTLRPQPAAQPTHPPKTIAEQPFVPQHTKGDPTDNPEARTSDVVHRKVARETVARHPGAVARPAPAATHRPQPNDRTERAESGPRLAPSQQLHLDLDWLQPQRLFAEPSTGSFELAGERPGQGAAWPNKDVARGSETWLSSRAVRFGGFYRRMHQAIAKHWQPGAVLERRDPTGRLYGTNDRHTVLHVRLDRRGRLAESPIVVHSSGLRLLDREAVRAVVAAAPFSNPPNALAHLGIIDLGRLSFYVEIDRGTFFIRRGR